MRPRKPFLRSRAVLLVMLLTGPAGLGQNASPGAAPGTADQRYTKLESEITRMLSALEETRAQLEATHREIEGLRSEIAVLQDGLKDKNESSASALKQSVEQLQEQSDLVQAEVKQHDQIKVETVSKYPVRISGLVLFTSALNSRKVDDITLPTLALPANGAYDDNGSLSGTLRQTLLSLYAKGPHVLNAESSADLGVDFYGGSGLAASTYAQAGNLRLRSAHVALHWPTTSLVGSYSTPIISPLQPASYLSVAQPALAWSGNLWSWAPQAELRKQFAATQFQIAFIDPAAQRFGATGSAQQQPTPAESTRQPGYETRVQYALPAGDRHSIVGVGGYYARQRYGAAGSVDAWAATADLSLPLSSRLEFSGEGYRGRALGSLGGGAFKDYVYDTTASRVRGLDATGGWAQMKARIFAPLEANAAFGIDAANAAQLREYSIPSGSIYSNLARNRTAIANLIYRPSAYLLLSAEYRNLRSWQITGPASRANIFGLTAGYEF